MGFNKDGLNGKNEEWVNGQWLAFHSLPSGALGSDCYLQYVLIKLMCNENKPTS